MKAKITHTNGKTNGNGKHKANGKHKVNGSKKHKAAKLTGYNPEFLKANKWTEVRATPEDASDRTRKLLSIARKASKDVRVYRKDNMLRVRYGHDTESALSLFTIRALTKDTPTITLTPRLREEKFAEVFKGTDSKAWKPTGAPPFDAELKHVGEDSKLVSRMTKILPKMIERAKES